MFISEEEAYRRVNSSENVLTQVKKDNSPHVGTPHTEEPPIIHPDEVLPPEDDQSCASAAAIGLVPSKEFINKILRGSEPGRRQGQKNMDPVMRAATATAAQLTKTRIAAETFGVSHHHADELKHGFHDQQHRYGGDDPKDYLLKEIENQKKKVRDLAFEKLCKALGLLSDDKLMAVTDPVKLARISKDLSSIHDKAMPREERADIGGIHFHVWRPEMREESSYETVSVGSGR